MHIRKILLDSGRFPTSEYYPFNLNILRETKSIEFLAPVTFFVGENGTGKSTLLKAVCRKCGIYIWEGIERPRVEYNPYENALHKVIDIEWTDGMVPGSFFGADIFRNFSQLLDEWAVDDPGQLTYFGGKSLMTQSHGQSLMSYFKTRYKIKGIYFLDEPETALSPSSQLELLKILQRMSMQGHAQFIIATHSPILMACPDSAIYSFDSAPIRQINYEETIHFQIYAKFMLDRKRYLDEL